RAPRRGRIVGRRFEGTGGLFSHRSPQRGVSPMFGWLHSCFSRPLQAARAGRRPSSTARRPRPRLEPLEARELMAAGALDPAFGSFGTVVVPFNKGGTFAQNDQAQAVAVDAQGRTVVAGFAQFSSTDFDFAVTRLDRFGNVEFTRTIAFD